MKAAAIGLMLAVVGVLTLTTMLRGNPQALLQLLSRA